MDIEANQAEQISIAADIMRIWDWTSDEGEFTQGQREELAYLAYRLAELIQATQKHFSEIQKMANRPGGQLRERTAIQLFNGPAVQTETLFADIISMGLHRTTVHATDCDGKEYEAYHFTIDVDRNLTAHSWFKI